MRRVGIVTAITVPTLLAILFLALLLGVLKQAKAEQDRLLEKIRHRDTTVRTLKETVAELRGDLDELVHQRLPDPLHPVSFDEVIVLEENSRRSILFTQVGTPESPAYEYRLITRNDKSEPVYPRLRILLFDQAGIQIGQADLQKSDDWKRLGSNGLAPDERGSFSGRFELQFDSTPRYFHIVSVPLDDSLPTLRE